MLRARVLLKNLENLTYNFPSASVELATQFTQELDGVFNAFYGKLPQEAGILIHPVNPEKIRKIKMKYRRCQRQSTRWTCSSLPRYRAPNVRSKRNKSGTQQVR